MPEALPLRLALRRGALIAAANWPAIATQFAAESLVKVGIAIPVLGGLFLAAVNLGTGTAALLDEDMLSTARIVYRSLAGVPVALMAFVGAVALLATGTAMVACVAKAGSLSVLVDAERRAGAIEHMPVRWSDIRRADAWSIDGFLAGTSRLGRRFMRLGLMLLGVYTISGSAYLILLYGGMRIMAGGGVVAGWPFIALAASSALVVWITLINLVYVLVQMVMAADDVGVREAARRLGRFAYRDARQVAGIFGVVLGLMVLAGAVSLVTTAGLGLIAFVPLAGITVLPLQVAAWVLRGLLFQYLGLTALSAYLAQYVRDGKDSGAPRLRTA